MKQLADGIATMIRIPPSLLMTIQLLGLPQAVIYSGIRKGNSLARLAPAAKRKPCDGNHAPQTIITVSLIVY